MIAHTPDTPLTAECRVLQGNYYLYANGPDIFHTPLMVAWDNYVLARYGVEGVWSVRGL
jgi:hypothetical protein